MKKKNINGKMIITDKEELELVKSMVTPEAFEEKFVLSISLTTRLLAEAAMTYVSFTDVSPVYDNRGKTPMN